MALPDGLLPVNFGVPFALPSSLLFPPPVGLQCGEPVGEGERGRAFPLPLSFLFGSCLNACDVVLLVDVLLLFVEVEQFLVQRLIKQLDIFQTSLGIALFPEPIQSGVVA